MSSEKPFTIEEARALVTTSKQDKTTRKLQIASQQVDEINTKRRAAASAGNTVYVIDNLKEITALRSLYPYFEINTIHSEECEADWTCKCTRTKFSWS